MSEQGMMVKTESEREKHATAYAITKARDVAGEFVEHILSVARVRTNTLVVADLEAWTERRLTALLKNGLTEFSEVWTRELERRADALQKLASDAINFSTQPQFVTVDTLKPPSLGEKK